MADNNEESSKRCPDCSELKPVSAFAKNPTRPDGLQFYCKSCYSQRSARYYRSRQARLGRTVRERVDVPAGMKHCPRCRVVKPHEQFDRARSQYDGFYAHSKSCRSAAHCRYYFRKTYGIEPDEVEAMLADQGERCAICRRDLSLETAHLDHNHESGEIRGLLCFSCNGGLGQFQDSPNILQRAAEYLEGEVFSSAEIDPDVWLRRLAAATRPAPRATAGQLQALIGATQPAPTDSYGAAR